MTKGRGTGPSPSPAVIAEAMLHRTSIGVSLVTLAYILAVAIYLVNDRVAGYLDRLQLVVGIAAIVVVFPAFWRYSRLRGSLKGPCQNVDSFMAEMFNRAARKAFSLTFIFLIALEVVTKKYFTSMPTAFFINMILAFTLGVFSITFNFLVRKDSTEENADDFVPETQP